MIVCINVTQINKHTFIKIYHYYPKINGIEHELVPGMVPDNLIARNQLTWEHIKLCDMGVLLLIATVTNHYKFCDLRPHKIFLYTFGGQKYKMNLTGKNQVLAQLYCFTDSGKKSNPFRFRMYRGSPHSLTAEPFSILKCIFPTP